MAANVLINTTLTSATVITGHSHLITIVCEVYVNTIKCRHTHTHRYIHTFHKKQAI
jgi:hypothetical protein